MEHIQVGPVPPIIINEYSARSLREQPTRDVVNAREYLRWNADLPTPSANRPKPNDQGAFFDMAPLSARQQPRGQFLQAQPYVVDGPAFQDNPYFNKYDITSDPRNAIRELRGAVIEDITDKGLGESIRLFKRGFDRRNMPVDEIEKRQGKALDDWDFMRPKMDVMEKQWRAIGHGGSN